MQEDLDLNDNYRRDLSYVVREVDRLNSCVEQLLTPPLVRRSDVELPELFDNICRAQNHEHAKRNVRIEWRAARSLILPNADLQGLHEIVFNLVKNAAQASRSGDAVELSAEGNGGGKLAITVTDHGTGIPVEDFPKIFDPGFTTKKEGRGLGLDIVKRNVTKMGGEIRLEPVNEESGTKATVTLPFEVV